MAYSTVQLKNCTRSESNMCRECSALHCQNSTGASSSAMWLRIIFWQRRGCECTHAPPSPHQIRPCTRTHAHMHTCMHTHELSFIGIVVYCRTGNFRQWIFPSFTGNDHSFEIYFRFLAVQHIGSVLWLHMITAHDKMFVRHKFR